MSDVSFNLYERVRIPDQREGFVHSISFPGTPPDGEKPPDTVTVMTDDYVEVECWPWQATKIRRTRGQTVKSKDPKGSFYPVELENEARLKMAIWHDHWDRFPAENVPNYYINYWEEYSSGNKAPLPAREDIRSQAARPPVKPQHPRMF